MHRLKVSALFVLVAGATAASAHSSESEGCAAPLAAEVHRQHSYDFQSGYPKAEFFGGYTYVHLDGGAGWMDGWNAAVTGNINPFLGVKAEGSGLYAKNRLLEDLRYNGYSFMAGPQVTARGRSVDVFGHALFGAMHFGASAPFAGIRVGASFNAFCMAFGGGADWHRDKWGIRIIQADYLPVHAFGSTAHNIRLSSGFLFRFQ